MKISGFQYCPCCDTWVLDEKFDFNEQICNVCLEDEIEEEIERDQWEEYRRNDQL